MCFFKPPKIDMPETPTPAPLPPPVEDAPKVESVEFGGKKESVEDVTGVKGSGSSGKSALKIQKTHKPVTNTTGANVGLNTVR